MNGGIVFCLVAVVDFLEEFRHAGQKACFHY
jgi:hypothetical protein